jgi:hypothetical protein
MGLLEKALRESAGPAAVGAGGTSLYAKAIAAATGPAVAPAEAPVKARSIPAPSTSSPAASFSPPAPMPPKLSSALAFTSEDLSSLESELLAAAPTHDIYLASWSKASAVLRLASMALFMPKGDSLVPVARIGFPPKPMAAVPALTADQALGGRDPLDSSASGTLAVALGASPSLPLRAAAVHSGSRIAALWVYRDAALEASPRDLQSNLGAALSAASGRGAPLVAIIGSSGGSERALLDSVSQSAKASFFVFDLSRLAGEISASCPGVSVELLVSSFASACSAILSGEGAASPCGTMRIGCALGSSSSSDHELALFQFVKSLKRLLPFLSVASFPSGRSTSLAPSSSGAASELAEFLAG